MAFEDSIAKIAADIGDSFAEDISRCLGNIISEENDYAYQELQIPTVRANLRDISFHSHADTGQLSYPKS